MLGYDEIDRTGAALASAHRSGTLVRAGIDLSRVGSLAEALAVQAAACLAHGGERIGRSLAATTPLTARLLGCDEPVIGPLFPADRLTSGASLPARTSMLGVGAQLAFVFGRSLFPEAGEEMEIAEIADAIASCHVALQVLGRRVPHATPLDAWTATADLGLVEAFVEGAAVRDWRARLREDGPASLRLDGHVAAEGRLADLMGHPLAPLAWLARRLGSDGDGIDAGDIVTTGSCTGLLQIRPDAHVTADFGDLGTVTLRVL